MGVGLFIAREKPSEAFQSFAKIWPFLTHKNQVKHFNPLQKVGLFLLMKNQVSISILCRKLI